MVGDNCCISKHIEPRDMRGRGKGNAPITMRLRRQRLIVAVHIPAHTQSITFIMFRKRPRQRGGGTHASGVTVMLLPVLQWRAGVSARYQLIHINDAHATNDHHQRIMSRGCLVELLRRAGVLHLLGSTYAARG